MSLLLALIGRLFVIAFALFVALLAGSLFVGFGLASGMVTEFFGPVDGARFSDTETGNWIIAATTIALGIIASFQLAGFAALPVTIAVAMSELLRWRGMTTHLVLGGLCALFVMFGLLSLPEGQLPANGTVIVSLAAGFTSAFFYWMIAGRNAGEWLGTLGEEDAHRES